MIASSSHMRTYGVVVALAIGVLLVGGISWAVGANTTLAAGTWTATGSMASQRAGHSATLLPNGLVLVAGGGSGTVGAQASSELYNPATGQWSPTGSMSTPRSEHTATLLSNGRVLVVGGTADGTSIFWASTELYDPATGTWSVTGSMTNGRVGHVTTLLSNGKVLVAGGYNGAVLAASELYDPITGTWGITGSMGTPRVWFNAGLLPSGKVLAVGGTSGVGSSELYDPAGGTWSPVGSMSIDRTYIDHIQPLLLGGKVLIEGGTTNYVFNNDGLSSAELYDPATGTWSLTGSMTDGRQRHTATLLTDGRMLATGGYKDGANTYLSSVELYDPATGTWSITGSMTTPRSQHTATLLPNGSVLVTGGYDGSTLVTSAELYGVSGQPMTPAPTTPVPAVVGGIVELVSGNDHSAGANWPLVLALLGMAGSIVLAGAFLRSRRSL